MEGTVVAKRRRREETLVCERCCAECFSPAEFVEHKKSCTKHPPVLIMSDGPGPADDFPGVVLSPPLPTSPGRQDGPPREDALGGSLGDPHEKPLGAEPGGGGYLKTEGGALPAPPQDMSYVPKGKVASTNVTLQALRGTKVAVNQRSADAPAAPLPGASSLPWVLEQILCLQQQQLQQIQLTEQIRVQVNLWASHALHAGAEPLKTLGGHVSQQVSAAVALLSQKAGGSALALDALKPAKLPPATPSPAAAATAGREVSQGLAALALKPDGPRVVPNVLSRLPGALLPQAPGSVLFPGSFSTVALDPSKKGKGEPPHIAPADAKPKDESALYKHKCKYCSKVLGTDSSLQIHLRSHTGERPFVCSVCGHRFTTKGNLKVHFHRHPQVKANPLLFADFHERVAAGGGGGPPYVPVDEASLGLDSKPGLAAGPPHLGLPQNLPAGTHLKDPLGEPQPGPSPDGEEGARLSGLGASPQGGGGGNISNRTPEPGSETLKLQQLVENIDKATSDPNECLVCHRVLSCQSSLKMHYRTHTGERPFPCRVCGRAFSTKGNLKTHLGVHRTSAAVKTQHSCPICQKKFTNAVLLQQHIRMHMGGQIPNTPLPDPPSAEPEAGGGGPTTAYDDSLLLDGLDGDEGGAPEAPGTSAKGPLPLSILGLPVLAPPDPPGKTGPGPRLLQRQSSRENGSVESDGSSSSLAGDQEYPSRSPDALDAVSSRALSPATSQAESARSRSPEAGGRAEGPETGRPDVEGRSGLPSTLIRSSRPTHVKVEVPGAFAGPGTMSPGLIPLLGAQPRRQAKQHGCGRCGKNFSSASALQIHERTHTGEKPFVCNICGRAFTTKGNLKVHYMTHGASNSSARRGRKLAIENTMALLGSDGKRTPAAPEMFAKEVLAPAVSVDPAVWNQYATMLNGGLAMKANEISVIQGGGIPTLPVSLGASSLVNSSPLVKLEGSQAALGAEVEKPPAADSLPPHQFPHFLEENKIAVS